MMEFWVENPLIEVIFGIASFLGVVLLGWSNLMAEPPKAAEVLSPKMTVWERHRLRQATKNQE